MKYRVDQGKIYEFRREEFGPGSYHFIGSLGRCKTLAEWIATEEHKKYWQEIEDRSNNPV